MSLWRNWHTQAVQSRRTPGSNPGRDTITPGVGIGIRTALKKRGLRVRNPLGRPICPSNRIGIGTALRMQVLRVRLPPRTP